MATALQPVDPAQPYSFTSAPRVLPNRPHCRDRQLSSDKHAVHYGNIMYDRRVIRGNTYAQNAVHADQNVQSKHPERQRQRHHLESFRHTREPHHPSTPLPIEGRKHIDVQTDVYLEALGEVVHEKDVQCQTDLFLDRPATPLFIPAKSGIDAGTEILPVELFDFDLEVRPIVEILIGKTLEQSLLEVMEEEELASLRVRQRVFQELRNAETAETKRLEEMEKRRQLEKDMRKEQQERRVEQEKDTASKMASRAFAQNYLSNLIPAVFSSLHAQGYFYDPIERDVESTFLPWVMNAMQQQIRHSVVSSCILDDILRDVVQKRIERCMQNDMERGMQQDMERGTQNSMERGTQNGMERGTQNGMERGTQNGMERGTQNRIERGTQNGMERSIENGMERSTENGMEGHRKW
uniref:radial spoke head protein 3 homolog n=1 Tax=Myxine glutinosa TaxID=7769 RepID=UPI00358EF5FB